MRPVRVTVFGASIDCYRCLRNYEVPVVVQRQDGPAAAGVATAVSLHADHDLATLVRHLLCEAGHPAADRIRARFVGGLDRPRMTYECPHCRAAYNRFDGAALRLHTLIRKLTQDALRGGGFASTLQVLMTTQMPMTALLNAAVPLTDVSPVALDHSWGPVPLPDDQLFGDEDLARRSPARCWLETGDTEYAEFLERSPWQAHRLLRRAPAETTCMAALAHRRGASMRATARALADLESADVIAWPPAGTYGYVINDVAVASSGVAQQMIDALESLGQTPRLDPLEPHTAILHPRHPDPDAWLTVHSNLLPEPRAVPAELSEPTTAAADRVLARAGWRTISSGWMSFTAPDGSPGRHEAVIEFPAAEEGWSPASAPIDIAGFQYARAHSWELLESLVGHRALLATQFVHAYAFLTGRPTLPPADLRSSLRSHPG